MDSTLLHPKITFASDRTRTGDTDAWQMGWGASIAFSPDRELLATTDTQGKVVVWKVETLKKLAEFDLGELLCFDTMSFTPDSTALVICSQVGLRVWDRATSEH